MKKVKIILIVFFLVMIGFSIKGFDQDKASDDSSLIVNSTPKDLIVGADITYQQTNIKSMKIQIGDKELSATLANNSSAEALVKILSEGPITVEMKDYGNMEKVGRLGRNLPRNDESVNAEPGDIILYQGNALVIYYAPNSWNFTRLGKIDNVSKEELKSILGDGDVKVKLSLAQE